MIKMNNKPSQDNIPQNSQNARAVIINVDDLGLSSAVNEAVLRLAERGRVGASSYMVGGSINDSDIRSLTELNVDIGLHLDLTGVFPSLLRGSLKSLLVSSYLRRLPKKQVIDIINRQFDGFEDTFNRAPVFIDGHQHIHQFPVIRDGLLTVINERYSQPDSQSDAPTTPTISARVTTPLVNDAKSWIIYGLGGHAWQKKCHQHHITTNDYFGGVYDFDATVQQLAVLWEQWLEEAPRSKYLNAALHMQNLAIEPLGTYSQYGSTVPAIHSVPLELPRHITTTAIMCHPAVPNTAWEDEIKAAREREFAWLMSQPFERLLAKYDVRLVTWSEAASRPRQSIDPTL